MKGRFAAVFLAVAVLGAPGAHAATGVTLKAGTLGFGADVTIGVNEKVNARINLNSFSYGADIDVDEDEDGGGGGKIKPNLKLQSFGGLVDWHPWASGFRLSAGLYLNKNKLDLSAETNDTVEINDREYSLSDLGGTVDFNSVSPYLGIGYGNAVGSNGRWHFSCDFGVLLQGSPQIDLWATVNDPALQAQLDRDIAAEIKNIEDDTDMFTAYPVISLGVSYSF